MTSAPVVATAFGFAGAANLLRGTTSAILVGATFALLAAIASFLRLRAK